MKNLLSKTLSNALLSGVLASTFLLINCQKAPNREAKNPIIPPAKLTDTVGVCTEPIAKSFVDLKAKDKAIRDQLALITETDPTKVPEDKKTALETMAVELQKLSTEVSGALIALNLEACGVFEDNDKNKKLKDTAELVEIKNVKTNAGKAIQAKTGRPNAITEADAKEAATTLKAGQELRIESADLANTLSRKDSSGGAVAILFDAELKMSKILNGDAAKAALADKTKTACALNITNNADIRQGSIIKIMPPLDLAKLDEKTKRNVLNINLEVKNAAAGSESMSLICNIKEGKEREAAKEARTALGALVENKLVISSEDEVKLKKDLLVAEKTLAIAIATASAAKRALSAATSAADEAKKALDVDKENPEKKAAEKTASEDLTKAKEAFDKANAAVAAAQKVVDDIKKNLTADAPAV